MYRRRINIGSNYSAPEEKENKSKTTFNKLVIWKGSKMTEETVVEPEKAALTMENGGVVAFLNQKFIHLLFFMCTPWVASFLFWFWLSSSEVLINPFGEDDEDLNYIIDRKVFALLYLGLLLGWYPFSHSIAYDIADTNIGDD